MTAKTFNDANPDALVTETGKETELFVFTGAVGFVDFGGASLLIQKRSADGTKLITLKEIADLTSKDDRASRFILPANQTIECNLTGASAASLYVETQVGGRRNP